MLRLISPNSSLEKPDSRSLARAPASSTRIDRLVGQEADR
jgi:hypothetical protein